MMRRFAFGVLVVVAVLAMASVALAKKPDNVGKPTTTTTTAVPQTPLLKACEDTDNATEDTDNATIGADGQIELTIPGSGQTSFECLWTPNETADGTTATVTITDIGGAVKGLPTVFVRDDSPGDICLLESEWGGAQDLPIVASFDLAYSDDLPDGYEAWEGTTYWDFEYDPTDPVVGAHWCAPQDPVLDSLRVDANGTPLHFMTSFNAKGGGHIVVELAP